MHLSPTRIPPAGTRPMWRNPIAILTDILAVLLFAGCVFVLLCLPGALTESATTATRGQVFAAQQGGR